MTPTIVVLRVDGHGTEHLSLHTKLDQAHARLIEVGGKAWRDRFGYALPGSPLDPGSSIDAGYLADRLTAEGWRVRVADEAVEL